MVSELFDEAAWKQVPDFDFTDITYHRAVEHGTVRIAFNRPEVRNAFRPRTVDELITALDHARCWSDVGCVLLTGNGPSPNDGVRAFCSGGDQRIRGAAGYEYEDAGDTGRAGRLHILDAQRLIRFMPKVVICVVPGWAAGGGHSLHVVCDLTLASAEHARFKFALLTQGWLGNGPGAALLAKQLRYSDAMKILLTDEPFDAAEALRIGLVNEVVPHAQLMERAEKIARHICTLPPVAVRMMKEFVVRFGDLPTDQAWHIQNIINHLLIRTTTDGEEGRAAFNEKRPPNFTGTLRHRGAPWEEPSEEDAKRLDEAYRSGEF